MQIDIIPGDVMELTLTVLSADHTPALVYLSAMTKHGRRVMSTAYGSPVFTPQRKWS